MYEWMDKNAMAVEWEESSDPREENDGSIDREND